MSAGKCRSCAVCLRALGRTEAQAWAEARPVAPGSDKCAHCIERARALMRGDMASTVFRAPEASVA